MDIPGFSPDAFLDILPPSPPLTFWSEVIHHYLQDPHWEVSGKYQFIPDLLNDMINQIC